MNKDEYPSDVDLELTARFVVKYLSDELIPQKYEDDRIIILTDNMVMSIYIKFPDEQKHVFSWSYHTSMKCHRYNKGFWINYLYDLYEFSAVPIYEQRQLEIKQQKEIEENKLFGKINDSYLFERKGKK